MSDFDIFWSRYPRREAKLAALKAYDKARRLASAEDILAGLERYRQTMPDDKQYRPLPASWLNAGRWLDETDEPTVKPSADDDWYHECQQLHQGMCGGSWKHRTKMLIERGKREQAS